MNEKEPTILSKFSREERMKSALNAKTYIACKNCDKNMLIVDFAPDIPNFIDKPTLYVKPCRCILESEKIKEEERAEERRQKHIRLQELTDSLDLKISNQRL